MDDMDVALFPIILIILIILIVFHELETQKPTAWEGQQNIFGGKLVCDHLWSVTKMITPDIFQLIFMAMAFWWSPIDGQASSICSIPIWEPSCTYFAAVALAAISTKAIFWRIHSGYHDGFNMFQWSSGWRLDDWGYQKIWEDPRKNGVG